MTIVLGDEVKEGINEMKQNGDDDPIVINLDININVDGLNEPNKEIPTQTKGRSLSSGS